jgi:hypothetical protein
MTYRTGWLAELKTKLEGIAGEWNGDNPSIQEDRAHAATEAITAIDELTELLNELEI